MSAPMTLGIGERIREAAMDWESIRAHSGVKAGFPEWSALSDLVSLADACERLARAADERARVDAMAVPSAAWYDARKTALDEHGAALAAYRALVTAGGDA